jgi:hypothetical protein
MDSGKSLLSLRNCCLVGSFLLAGFSSLGQASPDPWLILVSGEKGAINAHTTRQDLVRIYGASNVVDKDVDFGEGEAEPATVVFPKDPERSIEILWRDKDKKTLPAFVLIEGETSRWKTVHNISLGTTLKELQGLNGRPFRLAGLGWDESGTVRSWNKGALATELDERHGQVLLRLSQSSGSHLPEEEQSQVLGDSDFSSDHPVMQKINPRVYRVMWAFPSPTR